MYYFDGLYLIEDTHRRILDTLDMYTNFVLYVFDRPVSMQLHLLVLVTYYFNCIYLQLSNSLRGRPKILASTKMPALFNTRL